MKVNRLLLNQAAIEPTGGAAAQEIKPVIPSAPSAEVLKQNFDVSGDDDIIGGELAVEPTDKKEVVKPEVKKVETAKKPEAVKEPEVKKAAEVEKGPNLLSKVAKKGESTRDYTGFSEQEQYFLKNMSKEAYEYVAPILRERKNSGQQQQPVNQHFFQHPQAYVLSPEYQQLQSEVSYAQAEGRAWMNELIKAQKGEMWKPLVGVNQQTGEFQYGPERQPTVEDIEMIRASVLKCQNFEGQRSAALQQLPNQFTSKVNTDLQAINQERAKRFDWVAKPELLKHEIELEGVGKKSVEAIRNDFISIWPAYMQSTPGVEVAADLWVAMQIYGTQLKEAQAGKAVAETLKEEQKRVEPTSSARQKPTNAKFGVSEFDLSGLPE